ncbi:MAG: hypothetical protein F6K42_08625 [Leptolyngbya sp. SIO1D8]|nr:hypothetical protein [Leptolyngbya sp. SIO1D8]
MRNPFPDKQLPLDKLALTFMAGLVMAAVALVALGDHATARVQEFSWQEHTVGADNTAFVMTFNRPMDPQSVEANLTISPELPGRISWAGRRMAYTLDIPIPYGETFELSLTEAQDRFAKASQETHFEAFEGRFQSRDRAMAYIGTQGEENGRLVLVNFSQGGDPVLLTPPELAVLDFEPYPLGDRLLFSAIEAGANETDNLMPNLYTVATGLTPNPPEDWQAAAEPVSVAPDEAGTLTPILDSEVYQNLAFDLSPNGRVIVVQRVNQSEPEDFGPWVLREGEEPSPLNTEPGGEFLIGPDNQTLLMLQGQGTAIIPLEMEEGAGDRNDPLDFLPEFGRVFDLSSNGSAATMVDFNQNDPERRFMETLVVVTNQGEEQELLTVTGAILNAQFDPTDQIVYVLASELLPGPVYQEQPFLAAINLKAQEPLRLLNFPPQSRASMSIAPDGLAALVEMAVPNESSPGIFSVQTILVPLFTTTEERLTGTPAQNTSQVLPYSGLLPTWLP